ncbi:Crp/Fnr family transcriptional regulator [Plebeiibacterium marinum]|uniref:Crp/Fnr family transcriptional regulator n=1 Tax=Plebeiibacterium marinum TaxID=2992111 RepID=A0AAE3MGX4_9BACT|nr:Crp/Fnr family transcriptional regulator [Plebeiobacterium marinum]MCW3807628.1 Crp/Fnr family transcriptional regulator [Plebeiobacterium marinum]
MQISLVDHFSRYVTISDADIEIINKYIKRNTFNKKEELLRNGQVCKSLYFVEQGCLRMFYINSKSTEQITQFALDGWWMADFFSFMDQLESEYFIQAVEASKVVTIEFQSFEVLLKEVPQLERYFRIIMQKKIAASQLRMKYLYEMSKEEFYYHFVNSFPEFVQRVPQYMIASYLGLTPEYVSELRKKNQ